MCLAKLVPACAAILATHLVHTHEAECDITSPSVHEAKHRGGQSLIQRLSFSSKQNTQSFAIKQNLVADMSWTTNIGQKHHTCKGSRFEVDFTGTHKGMVVKKGMLLAKGDCGQKVGHKSKPLLSQSLTCDAASTGCHMWCAPVWTSYNDSTDWSAFDSRCKGWNGDFKENDSTCAKTGRLFTWARTMAPKTKNVLELTFAITESCKHWCSPLWVTIYDSANFGKSFRWCFNRENEFSVCDHAQDVSINGWQTRRFAFHEFLQKHGYDAEEYVVELATYSEFQKSEVLFNQIDFSHVTSKPTTTSPPVGEKTTTHLPCGSQKACDADEQCCRQGDSMVNAKCCPSTWSCCEDSCCPAFYTCAISDLGHTCVPPKEEAVKKPELCRL